MNPPSIEAIGELIEEALEMLWGFQVVGSDDKPLEVSRNRGDPGKDTIHLGRRHARMGVMTEAQIFHGEERQAAVGSQASAGSQRPLCPGFGGQGAGRFSNLQTGEGGTALAGADGHSHGFGPLGFVSPMPLFIDVAAELRIVQLDEPDELVPSVSVGHGGADFMGHGPDGLVGTQAQPALSLEHGDPMFILPHEEDQPEPGSQRDPGFMEDRPCGQRDLMAATLALVQAASSNPVPLGRAAARAVEAAGPAALLEILPASQFGGELTLDPQQVMGLVQGSLLYSRHYSTTG